MACTNSVPSALTTPLFAAAPPPDVRRRLRLAVSVYYVWGCAPRSAFGQKPQGSARTKGKAHCVGACETAGHSRRRTSGGEAASKSNVEAATTSESVDDGHYASTA